MTRRNRNRNGHGHGNRNRNRNTERRGERRDKMGELIKTRQTDPREMHESDNCKRGSGAYRILPPPLSSVIFLSSSVSPFN